MYSASAFVACLTVNALIAAEPGEKDNTMISEKMAAAINDQIKAEFDSAYIYLGMAAYFQDCNLPGMAHWMEKVADRKSVV